MNPLGHLNLVPALQYSSYIRPFDYKRMAPSTSNLMMGAIAHPLSLCLSRDPILRRAHYRTRGFDDLVATATKHTIRGDAGQALIEQNCGTNGQAFSAESRRKLTE
jgi:hypothetical protein